jgi:hypothetical protein
MRHNHDPDQATRIGPGRHGPAQTIAKQPITFGTLCSHHVEDHGTSRETIKAATNVSAGHGLDLLRARRDSNP